MRKLFYILAVLFVSQICIAQQEFSSIKLTNTPVTVNDTTSTELLVRYKTPGTTKGMVRKMSWGYLSGVISAIVGIPNLQSVMTAGSTGFVESDIILLKEEASVLKGELAITDEGAMLTTGNAKVLVAPLQVEINALSNSTVMTNTETTFSRDVKFDGVRKIFNGTATDYGALYMHDTHVGMEVADFSDGVNYSGTHVYPASIYFSVVSDVGNSNFSMTNGTGNFSGTDGTYDSQVTVDPSQVLIRSTNPVSKGLVGNEDYSTNNDGTDRKVFVQTGYLQDAISGVDFQTVLDNSLTAGDNQFELPDSSELSGPAGTFGRPYLDFQSNFMGIRYYNSESDFTNYIRVGDSGLEFKGSANSTPWRLSMQTANLTANRNVNWPDKDGVVAYTNDLTSLIPYSGASGNVTLGTYAISVGGVQIRDVVDNSNDCALIYDGTGDSGTKVITLPNTSNTTQNVAYQSYVNAKVANDMTASTTIAPSKTSVKTYIDAADAVKLTNGGDTTGAAINIGSNDAQTVNIEYNNSSVFSVNSTTGAVLVSGGTLSNSVSGRGQFGIGASAVSPSVTRNMADGAAAFAMILANTSSTGNIAEFNSNISGTTANRAAVTKTGQFQGTGFRLSALNTAPSSSTDIGTTGEIRVTSTYIYVCTATNTWVRSALTTW